MSGRDHGNELSRGRYRFGAFTLDLERGFVRRGDTDVPLRPKAFEALAYLVARHGKLVTKAELIAAVWPDTSVTDNSLSHCLLEIRRAWRRLPAADSDSRPARVRLCSPCHG